MNRTIKDIQKDIEQLGIKGGYDVEQLLTPQDCRRLSYEIERLNNIINELEKRCNEMLKLYDTFNGEQRFNNWKEYKVYGTILDWIEELKGGDKE